MNDSFTAIHFETATERRSSVCRLTLVSIKNGRLQEQFSILVRPPNNYYWASHIAIHHINPEITGHAPTFNFIWNRIRHLISNKNVVASNGFAFECIKETLEYYKIPVPNYTAHSINNMFGEDLATICSKCRIPFKPSDSLSEVLACAEVYSMKTS